MTDRKREPYRSCTVCAFGYCAPRRCYCSHPECSAYESYIDKSGVKPPGESETE